jgi:hypothetical protein
MAVIDGCTILAKYFGCAFPSKAVNDGNFPTSFHPAKSLTEIFSPLPRFFHPSSEAIFS